MTTLESDLALGVGTRLDSVLGQCMYFGLSFSRVGADFRGLLVPIFQHAILSELSVNIKNADQQLDETMQSYTLLGMVGLLPTGGFNVVPQVREHVQLASIYNSIEIINIKILAYKADVSLQNHLNSLLMNLYTKYVVLTDGPFVR